MTPQEKAALAMAGYKMEQIEAMTAPPVTVESLSAEVAKLKAALEGTQAEAARKAEAPNEPTAADILKGMVTAPVKEEK